MSYVTYVLQKLFGYSKEKAEKLMLDVHHKGKAIVSSGARERMEHDASRLHALRSLGRPSWHGHACEHGRMSMFRRDGSPLRRPLQPEEVKVLRQVATEVVALLTDGFDRDDPVVERLFPDVYRDDPAGAADLRQYTEGDLKTGQDRPGRRDAGGAAVGSGGTDVALDEESAEAWLRALNDVRLALGTRLDVHDDMDLEEELDEAVLHDPTSAAGRPAVALRVPRAICRNPCSTPLTADG